MLDFKEWPMDAARMKRYRLCDLLYDGEHEEAFADKLAEPKKSAGGDGLTWLELDYPRIIVDVSTNLLVGETPVISYEDKELNDTLRDILERSRFAALIVEVAQAAAKRGDGVMVATWTDSGVVIEPKPAYSYFPEQHPDNCRAILSEQLAWARDWGSKRVLRVDRYLPGLIHREAYCLSKADKVGRRLTGHELADVLGGEPELVGTGLLDRNTLVHIPNQRSDHEYFGRSDLGGGLPSLFEELNWRVSQISRILDKHADPKMFGPPIGGPLASKNGVIDLRQIGYIEVPKDHQAPQYLVWDAQLIQAIEQYNRVVDEILRHSETAAVLAGKIQGARFDSARAYRIQLAPTLAKNSRKRTHLDPAIKEICRISVAMMLGRDYADVPAPAVSWRDGLPKDTAEASQTENNRIASKTSSRLSAIRRLDDCDEQTALAEMARIEAEQATFGAVEMPAKVAEPATTDTTDETEPESEDPPIE